MSGPRSAEARLRRLLVMLPWLMEVGEVPLAEVARRFAMTEDEVQSELELVAMCGLPPFVDEMIEVFVDEGTVYVGIPRLFTRPLRLTAPAAFSLLAAARAGMELPGADPAGPLGRGLAKLAASLAEVGVGSDDTTGVVVDLARPALTDVLADAAAAGAELRITYYSPARDDVTTRTVVPLHVFADAGNWYVLADDGRTDERRTFRVDRIEDAASTGRIVEVPESVQPPGRFFDDADLARAEVRLAPAAQWVVEQYPVDEVVALDSGWVQARLPVSSERWLARLLIRLGPDVELVEPGENPAIALAERILERYAGEPQRT